MKNTKKVERSLAILSLMLIILAGFLGVRREAREVYDFLEGIVPQGYRAESIGTERFALYTTEGDGPDLYLINESSAAYGRRMVVSVLVDTSGTIADLKVASHRETPSFMAKTEKNGLRRSLIGKSYEDPFTDGIDVDVVSGATYTSEAMIRCAQAGSGKIARDQLKLEVEELEAASLEIGVPEVALVLLYILALIGVYIKTRHKKAIRWVTLLGSMLVLGFWFSVPLTLAKINVLLMGVFPDWHTHFFWYLLIGAFLLPILLTGKNIYCTWICPLAGFQECLGAIGGARPRFSWQFNRIMHWVQRIVALLAILLALYYRNPAKLNYEIFGVALSLTGATYLFILTGIFLMASVYIRRPWCTYLCPVIPVSDMLRLLSLKRRK